LHGLVGHVGVRNGCNRLGLERVERLANRVDHFYASLGKHVGELGVHLLHAVEQASFAIVGSVVDAALEVVKHGDKPAHDAFACALLLFFALLVHATAVGVPFRMQAHVLVFPLGHFSLRGGKGVFGRRLCVVAGGVGRGRRSGLGIRRDGSSFGLGGGFLFRGDLAVVVLGLFHVYLPSFLLSSTTS
jgi:hypothetical protein